MSREDDDIREEPVVRQLIRDISRTLSECHDVTTLTSSKIHQINNFPLEKGSGECSESIEGSDEPSIYENLSDIGDTLRYLLSRLKRNNNHLDTIV